MRGLSIWGGVLFGLFSGWIFFYLSSKKRKIALTTIADCLIPNILIGQIIGRWGNFFNQELLGNPINDLPSFFNNDVFHWFTSHFRYKGDPNFVIRHPLFLYEGLLNLGLWVFITFGLKYFFQFTFNFVPWKKNNQIAQELQKKNSLSIQKLKSQSLSLFKYIWHKWFLIKKNKWQLWKKYYYNATKIQFNQDQFKCSKQHPDWNDKTLLYWEHTYNPLHFIKLRSGTKTSMYFLGYGFIRSFLEFLRKKEDQEWFFGRKGFWWSESHFLLSIILCVIGIMFLFFFQEVYPLKYRKLNFFYDAW
jgi:phosphatidylglycerol:prolipoprotein diacylglycerol transferase